MFVWTGETVWLTQMAMSELFETTKKNISLHLKNISSEGELEEELVVKEYLTTAATGKTAAEIISSRVKYELPNMGLTTWKGAGRGRKLGKTDVAISKNYLTNDEISILELLIGQYLDFAAFIKKLSRFDALIIDDIGYVQHRQ